MMALTRRIQTKYLLVGALFTLVLVSLVMISRALVFTTSHTTDRSDSMQKRFDTSQYINRDGHIFVPSDAVLDAMTKSELEELLFRYQETIEVLCPRLRHIGDDLDGGYHVCESFIPKQNCLAYSFGNRKDYSFDDGLAHYYKCEVHSFDPDDTQVDHQHGEMVYFHKFGIGGKNEIVKGNLNIKTFDTIRRLLHHENRKVDLLKIDAEGAEWPSFKQMLEERSLQSANVSTLIVEFHTIFFKRTAEDYKSWLKTMRGLYEAGFRRYFFRMWHGGCLFDIPKTGLRRTGCHETHFVKVN